MNKSLIIALGIVLSASVASAAFESTLNQNQVYNATNATSTTATAQTLIAGDIVGYTTISLTPNTGSTTLTLPASSTLSTWLSYSGSSLVFSLFDASTTSGVNITVVAGTGTLVADASTTATVTSGKMMEIRVMRKPNNDLLFTLYPAI